MELSKGAKASMEQAQNLRVKGGADNLCVEHILYGLLILSRYLDPPLNQPRLENEAREVRALLSQSISSIESAAWWLDNQAAYLGFNKAASVIGRASEIASNANKREIDAVSLAKAVMESPTTEIRELLTMRVAECMEEEEKYLEEVKPESAKKESGKDISTSQLAAMLVFLAGLADNQHESLKNGAQKNKGRGMKRYTKMGFFTYRGGAVAAAIQYFLFGLFVPLAVLYGIDALTGIVTAPQTPFAAFTAVIFIIIWLYYIVKGVNKLIGLKSKPFGHFLDILAASLLCAALVRGGLSAYNVADAPTWLRIMLCLAVFLILSVGGGMFSHLNDQGNAAKTKIMFQSVKGTPGMVFFRFFTRELITPLLFFAAIWIFRIDIPIWFEKLLYILAFLWAWNILLTMWHCVKLWYDETSRARKGKGLVFFLSGQHVLLLAPGMGLYLHWLFGWFPMQTWVIVVYSLYGIFWLIASIAGIKRAKEAY